MHVASRCNGSHGPGSLEIVQQPSVIGHVSSAALLQELSSDARDWSERDALVRAAMEKFRLALRSRPDFDRGCYNLGTVFYTFAMALQSETGRHSLQSSAMHTAVCSPVYNSTH